MPNYSGGIRKFFGLPSGKRQMPPGYSMRDMGRSGMRAFDAQGNMISNKEAAEASKKYTREVEKAAGGAERFSNTLVQKN